MSLPILIITRNYPPKTGGLENYSYHLIREFEKAHTVFKLTLSRSSWHLIWFLPFCCLAGLSICRRHSIKYIHLCDGVLAPIGVMLKKMTGAQVTITIHGLDITFANPVYQALIPACVARLDRILCVSQTTREQCTSRKIPANKCVVIPNGIRPDDFHMVPETEKSRGMLFQRLRVSPGERRVLVTVGRLVRRKGVAWFVAHVMPSLSGDYLYLIVGDGPEKKSIQQAIETNSLGERVYLTGAVSDDIRNRILNAADIFVMPNIRIPSDVEGFGIAALEAGCLGLPVVASDIQGIRDAIMHGKTGYLVPEKDISAFIDKIQNMSLSKESIKALVSARFDWEKIATRYSEAIFSLPAVDGE
jgi:glycosyltransferase involved in cell wall biosynthesis